MSNPILTSTLIILRGNSASGKTTIAKQLQEHFGQGTLLVSQDVVRRDMLKYTTQWVIYHMIYYLKLRSTEKENVNLLF